jgi:hypothetical protein
LPVGILAPHAGARSNACRLQKQDGQRRQREHDRVRLSLPRGGLGPRPALVPEVAAAVLARVTIDQHLVLHQHDGQLRVLRGKRWFRRQAGIRRRELLPPLR